MHRPKAGRSGQPTSLQLSEWNRCVDSYDFHETVRYRAARPIGLYEGSINTSTSFRAVFAYWCVVLRDRPCILNGVTIDRDTLGLFPPGVEMEGHYSAGNECGVYVNESVVRALLGPNLPGHVVGLPMDRGKISDLTSMIHSELNGDPIDGGIAAHSFVNFDVTLQHLITPARERLACSIRDLIDSLLSTNLCISEVCRKLGVSVRTAERAFEIRFQETMSAYIERARLERARTLLLAGKLVTDAALDVGWTHLGRFSVEFRKQFGESLSTTRKRIF